MVIMLFCRNIPSDHVGGGREETWVHNRNIPGGNRNIPGGNLSAGMKEHWAGTSCLPGNTPT